MASPAPTCLQGLQATCFTDTAEVPLQKSQLSRRWLMLFFLCTGLLGSYYSYDIPSATQNAMQEYFAGGGACNSTVVDDDAPCASSASAASFSLYFNNLYSVYSFPNIILPFFGGYLSDRLGFRLMLLVFLALITAGQAIFALGASLPGMSAWWVMWAGRTVFGFGGESLSVAQSALIASWFSGKELAFALGLNLSLARMGSVINDKVSNYLATSYSLPLAFWVGFGVCLLSLVAGLFTYVVDQAAEDRLRSNAGKRPLKRTPLLHMVLCLPLCPCGRRGLAGDEDALTRLVDDSLEEEGSSSSSGSGSGASKAGDYEPEEATEVIELSAAGQFPLSFWLLCISCVCTYACVLCFNNVAEGFFAQKWLAQNAQGAWVPFHTLDAATKQSASDKATTLLLITYLVAAFLAPVFGGVIDLVGYRAVLAAFSSGLITVRARARALADSPRRFSLLSLSHAPPHPPPPPPTNSAGGARPAGLLPAGCCAARGPPGAAGPVLQHLRQRPVALCGPGH